MKEGITGGGMNDKGAILEEGEKGLRIEGWRWVRDKQTEERETAANVFLLS